MHTDIIVNWYQKQIHYDIDYSFEFSCRQQQKNATAVNEENLWKKIMMIFLEYGSISLKPSMKSAKLLQQHLFQISEIFTLDRIKSFSFLLLKTIRFRIW